MTDTETEKVTDPTQRAPDTSRMPVLFAGHGSPMNVIEDNRWSQGFRALSTLVPKPRAILAVSAHWFVEGTYLTGGAKPKTIHDFSGFPEALYEIDYPAPGSPDLAAQVRRLLGEERTSLTGDWGLDHGTWSVLRWMFPEADIPVVQLSIDRRLAPKQHLELGKSLTELRDEGVLVFGSGNVVHNLRDAFKRMRSGSSETPAWANRFDTAVEQMTRARDTRGLVALGTETDDGRLAHPYPDHWLPLLYVYGATSENDRVEFPVTGFDMGSVSMRCITFG